MRQTKNSKEVQGTGIAKQEQFNIANQKLFSYFDYAEIKQSYNNLLIGWISSDFIETSNKEKRIEILDFFLKSLTFIETIEKDYFLQKKEVPLSLYKNVLQIFSNYNFSKIKKYFNEISMFFLQSNIANDKDKRISTIYNLMIIKRYFKAIHNINSL